jgi:hypothetical protein
MELSAAFIRPPWLLSSAFSVLRRAIVALSGPFAGPGGLWYERG